MIKYLVSYTDGHRETLEASNDERARACGYRSYPSGTIVDVRRV